MAIVACCDCGRVPRFFRVWMPCRFAARNIGAFQVAEEMAARGDWMVPREQGQVFLSRPPLQQWAIALSEWVFAHNDRLAARFPCALAVLLTTILLYGYSRQFVGRAGAFVAALAYPTGGEVLSQAQQAETEALFVFLMSAALVFWHWGYTRKWSATTTWARLWFRCGRGPVQGRVAAPRLFAGADRNLPALEARPAYLIGWGHLVGFLFGLALRGGLGLPLCGAGGVDHDQVRLDVGYIVAVR